MKFKIIFYNSKNDILIERKMKIVYHTSYYSYLYQKFFLNINIVLNILYFILKVLKTKKLTYAKMMDK